jgi:hypothetical protein
MKAVLVRPRKKGKGMIFKVDPPFLDEGKSYDYLMSSHLEEWDMIPGINFAHMPAESNLTTLEKSDTGFSLVRTVKSVKPCSDEKLLALVGYKVVKEGE